MTRTGSRQEILDYLTALGPFFTVDAHPHRTRPRAPWRPFAQLPQADGPLAARVEAVRAALARRIGLPAAEIEPRVAASVTHLGLAARLIAPCVAAAATGHTLDMGPGELWWQDTPGGPVPLSIPVPLPPAATDDPPDLACLLEEVIAPLTVATSTLITVSPRVLWGNVASAVNGAAAQVGARHPDLSRPAWTAAAALLSSPRLSRERQPPGPAFRRSSCCLIYQAAATGRPCGVCGDCVLRQA